MGGNIGKAVTSMVESSDDIALEHSRIVELSARNHLPVSRQVAACLNVTPDHLDRHHTFRKYADAKARLFETQGNR